MNRQTNKREFVMLEKTPLSLALLEQSRAQVAKLQNKPLEKVTDAETLRFALSALASTAVSA